MSDEPTALARLPDTELTQLPRGYGGEDLPEVGNWRWEPLR
jgi:hypothetical protein